MHHAKDFFLSTLGIKVSSEKLPYDVVVQRSNEPEPFCIIKTEDGNTFLRVNSWDEADDRGFKYII